MLLTAVVALMTLSANAQVWLGGEVGAWRNSKINETTFTIAPSVGYNLSDTWAIGMGLGYEHFYHRGLETNAISVSPFARYKFAKLGPVLLFVDGGFDFTTIKPKEGKAANQWGIGIKPGLAVGLTEKLSFVSHLGFLGYRDCNDYMDPDNTGFGFNLGGDLTFGIVYNF